MHRHPRFNLWRHDDEELAAFIGATVERRTTIHEWPLSSVQRVEGADGSRHIYKVSGPPTVEAEFYARARSPLLVPVRQLPSRGTTVALLMPEVEGQALSDLRPGAEETAEIADRLLREIAAIEGADLPALADIRRPEGWTAYIDDALRAVAACISERSFHEMDADLLRELRRAAESAPVQAAAAGPGGYVHSDLMADNVLRTADGYRILDWQRPIWGPVDLDRATLVLCLGHDATKYVDVGVVGLYHLLHVAWFAQSARRWLPDRRPFFDRVIGHIAGEVRDLGLGAR